MKITQLFLAGAFFTTLVMHLVEFVLGLARPSILAEVCFGIAGGFLAMYFKAPQK